MTGMVLEGAGVVLVLALLVALLVGLRQYQRRCRPHPELVRKLLHVGMGLVCLSFPWLFASPRPVLVLAVIAIITMLALRCFRRLRCSYGCVLGDVQRASLGEIYFPIGVALVFLLSGGNPLLFCLPIALLTLADSAAALIGSYYGRWRYAVGVSTRTVEGSWAFFVVALTIIQAGLLFSGLGPLQIFVSSTLLALLLTLIESVSQDGLDNLLVPVAGCVLLMACLQIDLALQMVSLGIAGAVVGSGMLALLAQRWQLSAVG